MGSRFVQGAGYLHRVSAARAARWGALAVAAASVCAFACSDGGGDTSEPPEAIPVSGGLGVATSSAGPRPDFGKTVTLAASPPAITGGTLLITKSGTTAVASDPDRDQIYIVNLETQKLAATLPLEPGDEPGRLAEGANGAVYVALRRGGALVTVDVASQQIVARRSVCAAPRGVTYDPATDGLYVACNGGELVSLPAAGGAATRTLNLGADLRDVVLQNGSVFVSRLRSAEVIQLDANGNVAGLAKPPISNANMEPAVAWRLIAVPAASPLDTPAMAMVHQRAQPDPVSTQQGGYGRSNGGIGCMSSIVESTVTVFRATNLAPTVAPLIPPETRPGTSAGPTTAAPVIPAAVLPVDLAVSSDGQTFAVVAAGNGKTAGLPGVYLLARTSTGDLVDDGNGCATDIVHTAVPGQATAVALATHRVAWVQTREPAGLFQVTAHPDGTANVTASIVLSKESREDTGHSIVHSNSGAFIACASCHAEGGDDGRIWRFVDSDGGSASPARRTQTLRGTLADTAPYHWEGDMKDITMLAHEVFVTRMDGQTLDADQDAALKSWLVAVPAPLPSPPADASAASRGLALFASPGVGCTSCHNGPKLTNNQTLNVGLGGMFQVPSLIGVGWRAPYLHDGRALQLVDRFNPLIGGGDRHGRTTQLTTAEIDDLVQYLQTL